MRSAPLPLPPLTRLLAAVALAIALSLLAGCGYGKNRPIAADAAGPPARGPKLSVDTVRIGYLPNITHATALIGLERGFFARELKGTAVAPRTFGSGPTAIEALNAGSVDIAWTGPSPAINGFLRSGGDALRIVAGSASGGVRLVVNPDRIRSLNEVKGKRIATPQVGNTQDVAFLHWAASRGWKIDPATGRGDVSLVRSDNRVTVDAYRSGSLDGAWVPEPTASMLVAEGARVLLDEADLWPGRRFTTTNVIVSPTFLAKHRDVVDAVVRASVAATTWMAAHPREARTAAGAHLERLTGKALPAAVLDAAWQGVTFTNDPLPPTLRAQARHAARLHLLASDDLTGIYDLGPLNRALRSAGLPPVEE
ncbi:NitT/TauT family transport system substrate-binding protein [Streptomyces africanus]|uniref:NitT/TauT family transport system substrate-binding protein n=1 Tax=Streptomyces africanus TaxID=231024 RepID=A0ABU0QZI2_9ACTN|nr:ABC transporter substrate-binding protein [Streptomyces africanus]MDQ0752809.1 NitT/TauT family transport system substrate-binding protein [Streptomyces africanus]